MSAAKDLSCLGRFQNRKRAARAGAALTAYQIETGLNVQDGDALADLLADLMHWCEVERMSFETAVNRATAHFAAELAGDE